MSHESKNEALRWAVELQQAGVRRDEAAKLVRQTRSFAYKNNLPLNEVREKALMLAHKGWSGYKIRMHIEQEKFANV